MLCRLPAPPFAIERPIQVARPRIRARRNPGCGSIRLHRALNCFRTGFELSPGRHWRRSWNFVVVCLLSPINQQTGACGTSCGYFRGPTPILLEDICSMAKSAVSLTPTREDFEALLTEFLRRQSGYRGQRRQGQGRPVENDFVIIDVGLKTEGRIALKEFSQPGKDSRLNAGDDGRGLSRAHRECVGRSGPVARQGAARRSLDPARTSPR